MKIKFAIICFLICFFTSNLYCKMVLDFAAGEYYQISDDEAKVRKGSEEKTKQEGESFKSIDNNRKTLPQMTLPEDEMTKEEWEKEIIKNPWQKWVFLKEKPITHDYVNTSSNVVVITFLDYEGADRDGVKDMKIISEKYRLCCVLHPGDKYVETHDGKNGFRFARYLQAHQYCEEAKQYGGLKYMDCFNDFDKDGLGNWDELKGIKLKLKIDNKTKETLIFPNPCNRDTDFDGIKDGDEVHGQNGFVTDPTTPDTDGDGIPDKEDKNPLVSCKSNNPQIIPDEWAEYWSRGDKELQKRLLDANGDYDQDGLSNFYENQFETDPTTPNREKIIIFPKHLSLQGINDNEYESEFNILINTNVMTEISVSSGSWNDHSRFYPCIKYISSTPLNIKLFKWKSLYSEVVRDSKAHYKFAVVQPMSIHKFKISYKKEGWFEDKHIGIQCYNVDHSEDNYNLIEEKHIRFLTKFSKFHMPEKMSEIPKIIKPSPDSYFFYGDPITCEWTDIIKYPWETYMPRKLHQKNNVFLDKDFSYKDRFVDDSGWAQEPYGKNYVVCNLDYLKDEFLSVSLGVEIRHVQNIYLLGEYVPVFRTRRLTEDCSFVFKPDTMRNIRLQAKYGKDNYQKILAKENE